MPDETILVVEDDKMMRDFLKEALTTHDYKVIEAQNVSDGLDGFRQNQPDLVIADIRMPGKSGLDFLGELRAENCRLPVIMITAYGNADSAVEALRKRANDFLRKPFEADEIIGAVERQLSAVERAEAEWSGEYNLVYESEAMQELVDFARQVAAEAEPVLIEGESGVGKEVFARYIHYQGPRADAPLVSVNCGAIPSELLESELFGHTRGAFTGAREEREGLFQAAEGGTLFLDEIGDLPVGLQSKLLRALENKEIKPVGSDRTLKIDVRIIAASNRNLAEMVEAEQFRDDLFYRLNVFSLSIPPLRDRPADIPVLIEHFLNESESDLEFSKPVIKKLTDYPWPGNVREIQNVLRRLQALENEEKITLNDLRSVGLNLDQQETEVSGGLDKFPPEPDLQSHLREIKREYIKRALAETDNNKSAAADLLGVNRTTLVETINRLGIEEEK